VYYNRLPIAVMHNRSTDTFLLRGCVICKCKMENLAPHTHSVLIP